MNFHKIKNINFLSLLKHVSSSFIQARLSAHLRQKMHTRLAFWRGKWVKNGKIVIRSEAGQPKQGGSGGEEGRVG